MHLPTLNYDVIPYWDLFSTQTTLFYIVEPIFLFIQNDRDSERNRTELIKELKSLERYIYVTRVVLG